MLDDLKKEIEKVAKKPKEKKEQTFINENDYYTLEEQILKKKLQTLFYHKDNAHEVRRGLHASSIIKRETEFCLRQQVLSLFFVQSQWNVPQTLIQIFAAGNYIHEKWQDMFQKNDFSIAIEERGYSKKFDLLFTPDAIVEHNGKKYIVEIKSMSCLSYSKAKAHPNAENQIQLYMHLLGMNNGIILMECKNTQAFKIKVVEYDYKKVLTFVTRMCEIIQSRDLFLSDGTLPEKKCDNCHAKKVQLCNMLDACMEVGVGRVKLEKI
jgi:CRISPR/Cas system-associated exonuclease Cas4 (RecB family)